MKKIDLENVMEKELRIQTNGRDDSKEDENPRPMTLFFYYPDEEYVAYLMTKNELMFVDEIDCIDLFQGENERERILIFEVV